MTHVPTGIERAQAEAREKAIVDGVLMEIERGERTRRGALKLIRSTGKRDA
ncbi:MAG: hypothetical protein KGL39_51995 [Patescibacteria group bacterium]|nr:hypothetical protein [Patescibacteria group bacterium]